MAANQQLAEFQPKFPYGSSKRRSPFFAWQKMYRTLDANKTLGEGQVGCETLAGKDAREAAATLKFKLLPFLGALERLGAVAHVATDSRTGEVVQSGAIAKRTKSFLDQMTKIGNEFLPIVELYRQSRKAGSDIALAGRVTPQIAMIPAVVSFPREDNTNGNPNMIPVSWFSNAFTSGSVPLFTPNPALSADLSALLQTSYGGQSDAAVAQLVKKLQAGGTMPPPLTKNAFVCGGQGEKVAVDDLDVYLMSLEASSGGDPIDLMAHMVAAQYQENFEAWHDYEAHKSFPVPEEISQHIIALALRGAEAFDPAATPGVLITEARIDQSIAKMRSQYPLWGKEEMEATRSKLREKAVLQNAATRAAIDANAAKRCRRGALYLYYSLGGRNLVHALKSAIANLDAIIRSGGLINNYEDFRDKSKTNAILAKAPFPLGKKAASLGAQFYYTFNPALAVLTQKMWNIGSPFLEGGSETAIGTPSQAMNLYVQQVGVYGVMLKASYENSAMAQESVDAREEDGILADEEDVLLTSWRDRTLRSTDQVILVKLLQARMKENLKFLYGTQNSIESAAQMLQEEGGRQYRKAVFKLVEGVAKEARRSGQQDRRSALLPYQDRTITDLGLSRLLAQWALFFMVWGDKALQNINFEPGEGNFGSMLMAMSPEQSRKALSSARKKAENAIYMASAFGSRAYDRYKKRKEERIKNLPQNLRAAGEALKEQGLSESAVKDIIQQAKKAANEDPPGAGESLNPISEDSPKYTARDRNTGSKRAERSYFPTTSPLAALETGRSDVTQVVNLLESLLDGSIDSGPKTNPRTRRPRRKRR